MITEASYPLKRAPFVGREKELDELSHALDRARAGQGQFVAVVGEAGLGKSRLLLEFEPRAENCTILKSRPSSHGSAFLYAPIIALLNNYFGLSPDDSGDLKRSKVGDRLAALDVSLEETLPYLNSMLSLPKSAAEAAELQQMDPQIPRRRALQAIQRFLIRDSENRPLVVIFEDLDRVDVETERFLAQLGQRIATERVLLLVNYQPSYQAKWQNANFREVRLKPLGGACVARMLDGLLGTTTHAVDVKRSAIDRAQGHPLFIEEIVRALLERNAMQRVASGEGSFALPATLKDLIGFRIGRLDASHRELLQVLSIFGERFTFKLVSAITNIDGSELEHMLKGLEAARFINNERMAGESLWTFEHSLHQQTAYESTVAEQRKSLHETAGKAIETLFSNDLSDHYGELAYHYSLSPQRDRAIEFINRAVEQAFQKSAYDEALDQINRGLRILKRNGTSARDPQDAQRELALQFSIAKVYWDTKGPASNEVERALERGLELCPAAGDRLLEFRFLRAAIQSRLCRAEYPRAVELGLKLSQMVEALGAPFLSILAQLTQAFSKLLFGELSEASAAFEQASIRYDTERETLPEVFSAPALTLLAHFPVLQWIAGCPDEALRRIDSVVACARKLSTKFELSYSIQLAGCVHLLRGEFDEARERAEQAIALADKYGFLPVVSFSKIVYGSALVRFGDKQDGLRQVEEGYQAFRDVYGELWHATLASIMGQAYLEAGSTEDGIRVTAEGLDFAESSGELLCVSDLYRLMGDLKLRRDDEKSGEGENHLRKALEIARKQGAKSFELRASTSMARLLKRRGQTAQARELLSALYSSFTEGFETCDLRAAKVLLDEL